MLGLIGVAAMLVVLALSLFITRLATVALVLTGLSEEAARFQARSAFTGTGFTTAEAEKVVDHPVRRRIIMWLMVIRSAGMISIIISLILTFAVQSEDADRIFRLGLLVAGVAGLLILARAKWVNRMLRGLIEAALRRWTSLDARDYVDLLNLSKDYRVQELRVDEGDWLAKKTIGELDLKEEGVTVLGIYRDDGDYVGVPTGDSRVYAGDTLVLYGRVKTLRDLDERRAGWQGDDAHEGARHEQEREIEMQDAEERLRERLHARGESKPNMGE